MAGAVFYSYQLDLPEQLGHLIPGPKTRPILALFGPGKAQIHLPSDWVKSRLWLTDSYTNLRVSLAQMGKVAD